MSKTLQCFSAMQIGPRDAQELHSIMWQCRLLHNMLFLSHYLRTNNHIQSKRLGAKQMRLAIYADSVFLTREKRVPYKSLCTQLSHKTFFHFSGIYLNSLTVFFDIYCNSSKQGVVLGLNKWIFFILVYTLMYLAKYVGRLFKIWKMNFMKYVFVACYFTLCSLYYIGSVP